MLLAAGGLAIAGGRAISEGLGREEEATTLWTVARWPMGVAVTAVGVYLLFRTAPRERVGSSTALGVGTATAVILWFLFSLALALYFSLSSSSAYGPLLSVIALLVWCSLSSLALHLGLAVTAEVAIREPRPDGLVRVLERQPGRRGSSRGSAG